jgi:sarcosine oxidase subunit beta
MPMTIYLDNGFHVRARDGRALLCWPTDDLTGYSTTVEESWIATVEELMRARVPALSDVKIDRDLCYAGLYEMSPDKHAIVGFAPGCENMFLVNGSSGHGVMHSPALGAITAAVLTGDTPPIDPYQLRPSRFAEGAAVHSPERL